MPNSRPPVSVVIPFGGEGAAFSSVVGELSRLALARDDEVLVAFNRDADVPGGDISAARSGVRVIFARDHPSSYYARNEGLLAATSPWILLMDADCVPEPGIIDRYFETQPQPRCGAVAGEVAGGGASGNILLRHARDRRYLQQAFSLRAIHPYAATANLLVRREAWLDVGGFCEDIVSSGDQDFCWRLLQAGWSIEYRKGALVTHAHRHRLRDFVALWVKYGRGRAWLNRRWHSARPRPKPIRVGGLCVAKAALLCAAGQVERGAYELLDGVAELAVAYGYLRCNRPRRALDHTRPSTAIFAWSDAIPDGRAGLINPDATTVEVTRRPPRPEPWRLRHLRVRYAEDDSIFERLAALAWLVAKMPWTTLMLARDAPAARAKACFRVAGTMRRLMRAEHVIMWDETEGAREAADSESAAVVALLRLRGIIANGVLATWR